MDMGERLIQLLSNPGMPTFDKELAKNLKILSISTKGQQKYMKFEAKIPDIYINSRGVMHPGAICTYIDVLTSIAIYIDDKEHAYFATAKLDTNIYAPIYKDATIQAEVAIEVNSKNLKTASATFYCNDQIVARGYNTCISLVPKL